MNVSPPVKVSRALLLRLLFISLVLLASLCIVPLRPLRPLPFRLVSRSPLDDLLTAYHPVARAELARARINQACHVRLPAAEELHQYPFSAWRLSRFAAYYNIHHFLTGFWNHTSAKPQVLDFGGSLFLKAFNESIDVTVTKFPEVDIHKTNYPSNSFDAVATDQVLEHLMFPHLAMLEVKRILKPGGIVLITSVAYNPLHESVNFHDYWRFMVDGLRILSMPFEGGIKICGGWGSAKAVAMRAVHGMGSDPENDFHINGKTDELSQNDANNPFLVWIVVQK